MVTSLKHQVFSFNPSLVPREWLVAKNSETEEAAPGPGDQKMAPFKWQPKVAQFFVGVFSPKILDL